MADEHPRKLRPWPKVGTVWRARRRGEEKRTVRVADVDGWFVVIDTLTNVSGEPPQRRTRTRMLLSRFHYEFDAVGDLTEAHDG